MTWLVNVCAFAIPLILDQWTKWWALHSDILPITINRFLDFCLTFNRGMSWSLLSTDGTFGFVLVNVIVVFALGLTAWYTYLCFQRGEMIIGQLFVLSGGLSNVIDRIFHWGVVDFIHVHYGSWSWPVFNIADMFVVVGVFLMLMQAYYNEKS